MTKLKKIQKVSKELAINAFENCGIIKQDNPSRFEIALRSYYLHMFIYIVISIISGFVLMPYAYYKYSKFKYKNAYVDNRRLIFTGEVVGAYISFIFGFIIYTISLIGLNFLTSRLLPLWNIPNDFINGLITTAINVLPTILFTSLIINRFYHWQQLNVHLVSDINKESYYEIHLLQAGVRAIINRIITIATFGFGRPLTVNVKYLYLINRQFYSGKKLKFNATLLTAYSWLFWRYYLIFATLGFYLPVYLYKENQWVMYHTHLAKKQKDKKTKLHII